MELPNHLSPYPGKREWQGFHHYGAKWTAIRERVLKRDEYRCQICGENGRVEVHHLRKHKPEQEHDPAMLITLCAACHRKARNPYSKVGRQLISLQLETGEPDELKGLRLVREKV